MSAPVGRETPMRKTKTHGRKIDALSHRPAPPASEVVIPYAVATVDNMSLGTGFTSVDFGSLADTSDGTLWDLNTGDVRVLAHGFYDIQVTISGYSITAGVEAVLFSQINVSSGSVGTWSAKQISGSAQEVVSEEILRLSLAGSTPTSVRNPQLRSYAVWNSSDTFPVRLDVQAYIEEDNAGVAKTPDIRLFIARLGSGYQ